MKKTIKIVGVESDMKKVTLLEDSGKVKKDGEPKYNKYKIWNTKKDGSPTKAYTQFQKIRPVANDELEFEVAEEEKEYNGFPYTDRTVLFFYTADSFGTPTTPQEAPQSSTSHVKVEMTPNPDFPPSKALIDALLKISDRLNSHEVKIEKNNWMLDEIMKKIDPQWNSLSQDEVRTEDLPT